MDVIDRWTHGRTSRYLWVGLSVACLGFLLLGRAVQSRELARQVEAATGRAQTYAAVVGRQVGGIDDGSIGGFAYRALYVTLRAEVFTDATAARMRVFGTDGTLSFSTDYQNRTGVVRAAESPAVNAAIDGLVVTQTVRQPFTWSTTGEPGAETELLQVFVPLRLSDRVQPAGTVEVDFLMDELRAATQGPWPTVQLIVGAFLLLCIAMAVLSFRAAAGPARGARPAEAGVRPRSRREAISAVREEGTDDAEATAGEDLDRELSETKRQLADVRERLAERELDALGAAAEPEPEPEPDDEAALVRASVTPVEDRPALSDEEVSDLRARLAHAAAMKKQGTSS